MATIIVYGYFHSNISTKGLNMRLDRLTTKFQEALADAQSIAVGKDNTSIEAVHVLLAMLKQAEGSVRGVISKAGGNVASLQKSLEAELENLAQVTHANGQVQLSTKLQGVLPTHYARAVRHKPRKNNRKSPFSGK